MEYKCNFYCLDKSDLSTLIKKDSNLLNIAFRDLLWSGYKVMGMPRNLVVLTPMYGMGEPPIDKFRLYGLLDDDFRARQQHLGILAFISDHTSHLSKISSSF